MAWLVPNVLDRVTDANGDAVNAGKKYIFAAGTTTPSTIYSSNALSPTLSNPIVADSGGLLAEHWLSPASYKIRYTDADGNTLQEIDEYVVPDLTGLSTLNWPVLTKTADYTVLAADKNTVFAVDASSAPGQLVTITANATTLTSGFTFAVINVGATGTVTIAPGGGETINGAASLSITTQYNSAWFDSRGAAGWYNLFAANTNILTQSIAFSGDLSPSQITSNQNDYAPTGLSTASVLRLDIDADRTITGITGGSDGRILVINNVNTGGFTLTLTHEDAASAVANEIRCGNNTDLRIPVNASAVLIYDGTDSRWRVVSAAVSPATQTQMETGTTTGSYVTPGRQHFHPATSKCWGEFTANSTTILASYNITSLADTATGTMTVTIATDFSSANWACLVSRAEDDLTLVYSATYNAKTAGVVALNSVVEAGSGSDPTSSSGNASWSFAGYGDL